MGKHFSFIHCADLHLGEPFSDIRMGSSGPWNEQIGKATFKAFEKAVDAALDSKSNSAVLIASLEPNASHVSEWQVAPVNMALQVAINVQVPVSAWIPASAVRDGSSIQVKTPSGMQERKVQVVALKDGRALVTVPEFQAGDALIL